MRKLYKNYISNFSGLSKEIWMLSLVTFINRAGAMVIPFLSLYLVNEKGFTLPQIGWIMTCFGLGSLAGTWVGGKLTDTIGAYKVITTSLFLGGLGFLALQFIDTFYGFCIGIFTLIFIADSYRPAIFVACDAYSKPKNVTRSIALIRLAINLGFSIGPVIGGIIIARISYNSLFWIDGVTCILAAVLLFLLLKPKKISREEKETAKIKEGVSPYKNPLYLLLILIMVLSGMMFVQYFSLIPLYYEQAHFLSEDVIGGLLFLNGIIIVLFEMPLVGWLERINISKTMATFWGILFLASSFLVLNLNDSFMVLVLGMILMTLGEMVESPFSNALALEMAPKGRKGSYMGLYSMSFSLSHIFGHNGGMNLADKLGYDITWYVIFSILAIVSVITLWLHKKYHKTKLRFEERAV
ncbi:MFS transporter [Marinirhabdus gelatinilytica]|uniref:Putative MFS family arabinose efflux permease n=1 Tax=Marinirhabdus gelatinilytica TaxID=1703343 RepID=A0A370Q8P5_9FLAO|nr:MFS transporter [Marinirhabdus gelatinilytica]RDK84742.1 putative MFS family arabinose efflux permease [Marinirhabdus gelatinilytica]